REIERPGTKGETAGRSVEEGERDGGRGQLVEPTLPAGIQAERGEAGATSKRRAESPSVARDVVPLEFIGAQSFPEVFSSTLAMVEAAPLHRIWFSAHTELVEDVAAQQNKRIVRIVYYRLMDIIDPSGQSVEPKNTLRITQSGTYRWAKWELGQDPASAEIIPQVIDMSKLADRDRRMPPRAMSEGIREAIMPRISATFLWIASNETEMAMVTAALSSWLETNPPETPDTDTDMMLNFAFGDLLDKALHRDEFSRPSRIVDILGGLSETSKSLVTEYISTALGKILLDTRVGSRPNEIIAEINGAAIAQAIDAFDRVGLIDDTLWQNYAIIAAGVVKTPEI